MLFTLLCGRAAQGALDLVPNDPLIKHHVFSAAVRTVLVHVTAISSFNFAHVCNPPVLWLNVSEMQRP